MKKRCYQMLFAILLVAMTFGSVPALALTTSSAPVAAQTEDTSTQAETTQWKFKTIDGVLHKRLWSVTYNRWLTDWIPC